MTIKYLGHACFMIRSGNFRIVIDPFKDVPGLKDVSVQAEMVCCSHEHGDHAYREGVTPTCGAGPSPFRITELESFHDDEGGAKRGPNTIRIFEAEGLRIAHFGDIGCSLTEEQLKELKGLDVAMIPVGGFFTIGPAEAKELYERIKPAVMIPMHYRTDASGYEVIARLEDFTSQFESVTELGADTMELPSEHKGIVVLKSEA